MADNFDFFSSFAPLAYDDFRSPWNFEGMCMSSADICRKLCGSLVKNYLPKMQKSHFQNISFQKKEALNPFIVVGSEQFYCHSKEHIELDQGRHISK